MLDRDNNNSDEDDNGGGESSSDEENENDDIDSGNGGELSDVILAFIDDEEEVERPATRSGRAITRRSEIDISFRLLIHVQRIQSKLAHFFFLTVKSDRCNLIIPKNFCVTVQYVYLV